MYWTLKKYFVMYITHPLSFFNFSFPLLVDVAGQSRTVKGCTSSDICNGTFSTQLESVAVGVTCCQGNLCNSAWSTTGRSALLLLWPLVSILLFHWSVVSSEWLPVVYFEMCRKKITTSLQGLWFMPLSMKAIQKWINRFLKKKNSHHCFCIYIIVSNQVCHGSLKS